MPKTKRAIVALLAVASLALTGVAHATPATPTITLQQTDMLKMQLTSSTGTRWSWTFLGSAGNVLGTATTNPAVVAFPAAGNYTASLDASDADPLLTAPAHAETTFTVYAQPVANFTYSVQAGGTVLFTDTSTGGPTTWTWTFPGAAVYQGKSPPARAVPAGTSSVTLLVANPAGSHSVTLPVVVNGPPAAALNITSTPTSIKTPVQLDAGRSTDPDGDPLTYSWDLNGDLIYGDAGGPLQSVSYAVPGSYRVGVQVSDGHGGVSTAAGFITVMADKPPAVDFTNSPAQPVVGTVVTFRATASDPDGTVTKLEWDLDHDGQFDDAAGPSATWTFPTTGSGIVAVRATDDKGVATVAFRTINVTGAPPVPTTSVAGPPKGSAPPPSPSSASGSIPQVPAPSSTRVTLMTPFPVVRIRGLIYRGSVRISLLKIQAPPGATVRVVCRGSSCSAARGEQRVKVARKPVRMRKLEHRSLRPGTVIEVFVTAPHRIGKYTRFTVLAGAAPARRDLCLRPGRKAPSACPTQ